MSGDLCAAIVNNHSNKCTQILTFGVNVAGGYLYSSGVGRKPNTKLQKLQMTGLADDRSSDTTTYTFTLKPHMLLETRAHLPHTHTRTALLSCGDI